MMSVLPISMPMWARLLIALGLAVAAAIALTACLNDLITAREAMALAGQEAAIAHSRQYTKIWLLVFGALQLGSVIVTYSVLERGDQRAGVLQLSRRVAIAVLLSLGATALSELLGQILTPALRWP